MRDLSKKDWRIFLDALLTLKKEGPRYANFGICQNISSVLYRLDQSNMWAYATVFRIARTWPRLKGKDPRFPVEGHTLSGPHRDVWDKATRMGRRRWAFLDYCIEYATKKLEPRITKES